MLFGTHILTDSRVLFIYFLIHQLLNTYCIPSTVSGAGIIIVSKVLPSSDLVGISILLGKVKGQEISVGDES